ncbi:MAG TPA: ABC transporter substrate-binding protein [Pseudonocardiaceae bacterium]|jgi:NitT/TauT family transport system substrate-binding protein|nr:ABC transporter substrate-binding protein [Pseudonocardiaceae bacterium]
MHKAVLTVAVAATFVVGAVASCSSGSANGQPTVSLMVGGIDKQIYLPYELAQNLGFYQKYGVNVELSTETAGGVGAEDAMVSGQVDMAGAWYNHAIDYQVKGKAVEGVVQLSGAPGERVMCAKGSNIHSPADFRGKTIGVTDLGSGTDTLTQFLAAKAGVTTKDFSRLAVGDGSTAIAALQNNKADCVMTTQPTVNAIEKKGVGYPAIDLATSAGVKSVLGGFWPAASVLARTDWINANKDTVQKVVDALVATMHWINTHTAADIANALPSSYTSNALVTKSDYIAGLAQDKAQFLPDGIMPAGGPKTVLAMEEFLGNATSSVNLGATFTNDFAIAANKTEGTSTISNPTRANG